jgi:hypothetical protein
MFSPIMCQETSRKTTKNFNGDGLCPDQDSKPAPPEYKSKRVTSLATYSLAFEKYGGSQIITAVAMDIIIFWDVT